AEARAAGKILGIAELSFLRCSDWTLGSEIAKAADLLRPLLKREQPELVYLPHPHDGHPDHQATLPILRAALKGTRTTPALRAYEVWTPLAQYDHVEDISLVMQPKLKALQAHESQLKDLNYARAVTGLNQY